MIDKIDIWSLLRARFPENEYALMQEVRDKAGFYASRSADYIAVNLWPSRGLHVNGIELKSYRNDWLGELKKPEKAENIYQFCDYFYLLTTDESIAKPEEIPATWGHLCIKGKKIFTKKEAPKLEPVPMDRHFVCAMLKRACNNKSLIHIDSVQDKINEAREQGGEFANTAITRLKDELADLRKIVHEFENISGIQLNKYSSHKISAEAVKFISGGGIEAQKKQLTYVQNQAKTIHEYISKVLATTEEHG